MEWRSNAKMGVPLGDGTIFESQCGVVIHRIIHCEGWFLSCAPLRINDYHLNSESFDDAVEESKLIVRAHLNAVWERLFPFTEAHAGNQFVSWFTQTYIPPKPHL